MSTHYFSLVGIYAQIGFRKAIMLVNSVSQLICGRKCAGIKNSRKSSQNFQNVSSSDWLRVSVQSEANINYLGEALNNSPRAAKNVQKFFARECLMNACLRSLGICEHQLATAICRKRPYKFGFIQMFNCILKGKNRFDCSFLFKLSFVFVFA